MRVDIPVSLVCKGCLTCKDLSIVDDGVYLESAGKVTTMAHDFSCKNIEKCLRVKKMLEDDRLSEE